MNAILKNSPVQCRSFLLNGVQKRQYTEFVHSIFKFTDKDFAVIAGTSTRTLSRLKADQNIPMQAAEVTISLMRAYERAAFIFGSEEKAVAWLKKPNALLDGESPVQAMSSRFGAEEVMDILGRIEYGVYS